MENLNLHKLKLYAIIAAGVALISLLLPWQTYSTILGSGSANGFRGWGWISMLGIIAVVVASLMGDKIKPYDDMSQKVALGGFAGIAAGAIIFMIRVISVGGNGFKTSPGFGLFICLLVGLAGIAILLGLVKLPDSKPPSPPMPPSPPPPAPRS